MAKIILFISIFLITKKIVIKSLSKKLLKTIYPKKQDFNFVEKKVLIK